MRQKKYEAALNDYRRATELSPYHQCISFMFKRMGWINFHFGHYQQALADVAKAVELRPDDVSNLLWISPDLVASCPDEKFRTGILALADKVIELKAGTPGHHAAAYAARGAHHAARKQYDKAKADFEKSLTLDSASHSSRYQYALFCLATGDQPAYRKACAEMLKQFGNSENAEELFFTTWTCALAPKAIKDYEPVLELARRAMKQHPNDRLALQGLGAALFRAGHAEEALKYLTLAEAVPEDAKTSLAYIWYFLAWRTSGWATARKRNAGSTKPPGTRSKCWPARRPSQYRFRGTAG